MKYFIPFFLLMIGAGTGRSASLEENRANVESYRALPSTPPAGSFTLRDCFEKALRQTETIPLQAERIAQLNARYRQALGGILPRLTFNATELIQDTDPGGDAAFSALTKREQFETKFVGRQPVFQGFREFSAMSSAKAETKRERWRSNRIKALLFQDVAQAFYTVIQLETDFKNVASLVQLLSERVAELKGRVRLGKSRESELLSNESQLLELKAEQERVLGQLDVERETLSLLVGEDLSQAKLLDGLPSVLSALPLEAAIKKVDLRSDIQALQQEIEARRYGLRFARGGYWPQLSATGTYYTKRAGFLENVNWDVLLNLDVPLFQGGTVSAQTKEALARYREAQQLFKQSLRAALGEVRQIHAALQSSTQEVKMLEEASQKAKRSYELQVKEYRLGLVDNLEVLQALNAMQQTKKSYDQTVTQNKLNYIQLQVAIEEMP